MRINRLHPPGGRGGREGNDVLADCGRKIIHHQRIDDIKPRPPVAVHNTRVIVECAEIKGGAGHEQVERHAIGDDEDVHRGGLPQLAPVQADVPARQLQQAARIHVDRTRVDDVGGGNNHVRIADDVGRRENRIEQPGQKEVGGLAGAVDDPVVNSIPLVDEIRRHRVVGNAGNRHIVVRNILIFKTRIEGHHPAVRGVERVAQTVTAKLGGPVRDGNRDFKNAPVDEISRVNLRSGIRRGNQDGIVFIDVRLSGDEPSERHHQQARH